MINSLDDCRQNGVLSRHLVFIVETCLRVKFSEFAVDAEMCNLSLVGYS